jgi:hypothetical protein
MKYQSASKSQDIEYIIGGVEIVMLIFLAYCAIAIPYYYIKKIYLKI